MPSLADPRTQTPPRGDDEQLILCSVEKPSLIDGAMPFSVGMICHYYTRNSSAAGTETETYNRHILEGRSIIFDRMGPLTGVS